MIVKVLSLIPINDSDSIIFLNMFKPKNFLVQAIMPDLFLFVCGSRITKSRFTPGFWDNIHQITEQSFMSLIITVAMYCLNSTIKLKEPFNLIVEIKLTYYFSVWARTI